MNFQSSKKHAKSTPKPTKCVSCEKEFPSYYSLQQHRKKDHGLKASDSAADLNKIFENEEDSSILGIVVSNYKIVHFYSSCRIQSEELFKGLNLLIK